MELPNDAANFEKLSSHTVVLIHSLISCLLFLVIPVEPPDITQTLWANT